MCETALSTRLLWCLAARLTARHFAQNSIVPAITIGCGSLRPWHCIAMRGYYVGIIARVSHRKRRPDIIGEELGIVNIRR